MLEIKKRPTRKSYYHIVVNGKYVGEIMKSGSVWWTTVSGRTLRHHGEHPKTLKEAKWCVGEAVGVQVYPLRCDSVWGQLR